MADQLTDRIAEVLWRADGRVPVDMAWDACDDRRHYRRMAEAVVSALELTEERRLDSWWGGSAHSVVRLVGPWRTAQDRGQ